MALGTMDTWLVYRLTGGKSYLTDYSNASRTQLYNIYEKKWDQEICALFGIDPGILPQVQASDDCFGYTDLEGFLPKPVPIHGVLGDSHGALLGQGCLLPGMCKATYGTGSSVMMQTGERPAVSSHGLVTSLAWGLRGRVEYVLEGNINYAGAVVSWMKDNAGLIASPEETEALCRQADPDDSLYLIPAFTGLGAPYWDSCAEGLFTGITRSTGRKELVRAGVECIAYQIADVVRTMEADAGCMVSCLRADGGAAKNDYLMQFQCDILEKEVAVSAREELSGWGAAYAAGLGIGLYGEASMNYGTGMKYRPGMEKGLREKKLAGWRHGVELAMSHGGNEAGG